MLAEGGPFGAGSRRRLVRCRPPRGNHAGRGSAGGGGPRCLSRPRSRGFSPCRRGWIFPRLVVDGTDRAAGRRAAGGDGAGDALPQHRTDAATGARGLLPTRRTFPAAPAAGHRSWPVIRWPGVPPAVPPLRRRLELMHLVAGLLARQPDFAPRSAAYDLADSLAALMDEMQGEGVAPKRWPHRAWPRITPPIGSAA